VHEHAEAEIDESLLQFEQRTSAPNSGRILLMGVILPRDEGPAGEHGKGRCLCGQSKEMSSCRHGEELEIRTFYRHHTRVRSEPRCGYSNIFAEPRRDAMQNPGGFERTE
jgi:hypothetical protein